MPSINIINEADVIDSTVIRIKKTNPAYFSTYNRFGEIKAFTDSFENLFLSGRKDKDNIWNVNVEKEYNKTE